MMSPIPLPLLLLLLIYKPCLTLALTPLLIRHPLPLNNRPSLQPAEPAPDSSTSLLQAICGPGQIQISEQWYPEQPLDHFNESNTATYEQHFLVNSQYYSVSGRDDGRPVVFLLVCGEWDMLWDAQVVCWENITYVQAAKEEGAMIVYLEHRFFGRNRGLG